jgi:hypothetical protein
MHTNVYVCFLCKGFGGAATHPVEMFISGRHLNSEPRWQQLPTHPFREQQEASLYISSDVKCGGMRGPSGTFPHLHTYKSAHTFHTHIHIYQPIYPYTPSLGYLFQGGQPGHVYNLPSLTRVFRRSCLQISRVQRCLFHPRYS